MKKRLWDALWNGILVAFLAGLAGWLITGNISPLFEGLAFLGTFVVSLVSEGK